MTISYNQQRRKKTPQVRDFQTNQRASIVVGFYSNQAGALETALKTEMSWFNVESGTPPAWLK